MLDSVGLMVWDETRDFSLAYLDEFTGMVRRDRNHPSVVVWSLCNEYECAQANVSTGEAFKVAASGLDGRRAVAANSKPDLHGQPTGLDVTGFSHAGVEDFAAQHAAQPGMPLVLSECCSCDDDNQRVPRDPATPRSVASECMRSQNKPGSLPYVAGSLGVWTGFDCESRALVFFFVVVCCCCGS